MADDDFSLPVNGANFSRLFRRTLQLGVDPETLVASVVNDVKTFYGLDVTWTITGEVVKKIRDEANGSGSWVVWFRVNGAAQAIVITQQPVGGNYDGVTPVTLTVVATGTGPITYQWQESPAGAGTWSDVVGATNSTYDATPVAATDYRVVVSNIAGQVISNTAAVTAAYVSPMVAAGFTVVSARDATTKFYQDSGLTVLADGTDNQSIQGIIPSAGVLWNNQTHGIANQYRYGDGANPNAIDGKPVLYTVVDSFTAGMFTDVDAFTMLGGGKEFDLVMVAKRLTAGDNKGVVVLGSNRPLNSRMYAGDVLKAYAFISAYAETANGAFTVGDHVLHFRFDDTANQLQLSIDGGAATVIAENGAWVPDAGLFGLGLGNISFAEYGLRAGLSGSIAAVIAALKAEYSIP